MPIPLPKYATPYRRLVRDVRPITQRMAEYWDQPQQIASVGFMMLVIFWVVQDRFLGDRHLEKYVDLLRRLLG